MNSKEDERVAHCSVEEWEAGRIRVAWVVVEIDAYLAGSYLTTAVGVDVFGLDPETKLHGLATFVLETSDSPDEGVEPAFELLLVDYPLSQTRRVSVAGVLVPEPAIVENSLRSNAIRAVSTYEFLRLTHQAAPNLICLPGDVVDLLLVKVEIGRLPVVDQHRSILARPV
jgi:hypothetical protein